MNIEQVDYLKSKVDNGTINIVFADGEKMTVRLISVSETESDIIYEMITTDRPEKYRSYKSTSMHSPFSDIESVG